MYENRKLHTYLFSRANVGKYNIGFQLKKLFKNIQAEVWKSYDI